jgi:hypothetical protein
MIGSWEKECKDVDAVSFSDSARATDEFLARRNFRRCFEVRGEVKSLTFHTPKGSAPREFQSSIK